VITLASQWNEYRDEIMKAERRNLPWPLVQAAELGFYAGALRMLKLINGHPSDSTISAWIAEIGRRNEEFGREADLP
jgi:hypothetical protein